MRAIEIIDQIKEFSINEFPQNALQNTDSNVLLNLRTIRQDWGLLIHPSRHPDGWARNHIKYQKSQHYAVGRLSTAGDFFPEGNVIAFWELNKKYSFVGGIGLYFDTNRNKLQPGPMIHNDLRKERLMWVRISGKYIYLNKNTSKNDWSIVYERIHKYLKEEV